MGAFFTNYQVRSNSSDDVIRVIAPMVARRAYVSPAKNGWATIYDEASDDQDEGEMRRLGEAMSKQLGAAVIAFLVHDSDVLMYFFFESGRLADEYNSRPDYFGKVRTTPERTAGKVDALLPYCLAGTTRDMLEQAIHPETQFTEAECILDELAQLLGMNDQRTTLGFKYFEQEATELLDDAEEFQLVGHGVTDSDRQAVRADPQERRAEAGDEPAVTPDPYSMAVGMFLFGRGGDLPALRDFGAIPGVDREALLRQLRQRFDQAGRKVLRGTSVEGRASADELITAADKGPVEFAKLLATKSPDCLGDIAVAMAGHCRSEWMRALVEVGVDVNFADRRGITALKVATVQRNTEMVNYLVSAGATH